MQTVVVTTGMPTLTVNLTPEQFAYIHQTHDDSMSERVRELLDKGMDVEGDE